MERGIWGRMHLETVRDWLTIVATGLGIGAAVFGAAWRFIVWPQLQINVFGPLESMRKELHPNGGGSMRDAIDRALHSSQENGDLLAGHIEESQQDHRLMLRLHEEMDRHIGEHTTT